MTSGRKLNLPLFVDHPRSTSGSSSLGITKIDKKGINLRPIPINDRLLESHIRFHWLYDLRNFINSSTYFSTSLKTRTSPSVQ